MEGCLVKALYNFDKEDDSDLNIQVGDLIQVTEKINDEWYKGIIGDNSGQFPAAFVELVFDYIPEKLFTAIANFSGQENEDLNFIKDDLIAFKEDIDENWFIGSTKGSQGLCPKSFVKEISFHSSKLACVQNDKVEKFTEKPLESMPYGESIDSFNAQSSDELSFPKGVKIELIKEIDSFWTEGVYNDQQGKFPSLFVKVVVPLPESLQYNDKQQEKTEPEKTEPNAKALFMYIGSAPGELSFDKGDIIILTDRVNAEWLKGRIGKTSGIFPANHVQIIVDLPFEDRKKNKPGDVKKESNNAESDKHLLSNGSHAKGQKEVNVKPAIGKKPLPKSSKPILKEKPVSVKPNAKNETEARPLLLTSRKQPLKADTISSTQPAVPVSSDSQESSKSTDDFRTKPEDTTRKPNNRPTIVKVAKTKPPARPSSSDVKNDNSKSESGVTGAVRPKKPISGEKSKALSSSSRSSNTSLEYNMPLLQTTSNAFKKNGPKLARPTVSEPSPNAQLLEQELNNMNAKPVTNEMINSKVHVDENSNKDDDRETDVELVANHTNDDKIKSMKRPAPKRPSKCPSKTSSHATSSILTTDNQGSPSAPSRPQRLKKQGGDSKPSDKSRTLPPRLPKPLAPLPPQRPAAASKSLKDGPADTAKQLSPSPASKICHTQQISNEAVSKNSELQDLCQEVNQENKPNSMFYVKFEKTNEVDGVTPDPNDYELESLEKRIGQIKGQIVSESNLLSGIETLLEVSDDKEKRNELLQKKRSLSVSLLDLDEELNACQDEKSYLLAYYGDIDAIKKRLEELSTLIESYRDSGAKLRKMKEIATVDELVEIRDGIEFCDNMVETLLEEMSTLRTEVEKEEPVHQKEDPAEIRMKLLNQRQKAIDELIKTEQDYSRDINVCSTKVLSELEMAKNIDCEGLFGNLTMISDISKRLLDSLERIDQKSELSIGKQIGNCFAQYASELKSEYSNYCRNYDKSQMLLEKLEQDQERRDEVLAAVTRVRDETGLWDLSSYLIKPVQRILKYPLILQEIYKYTPEDDQGRDSIQEAICLLKDVATAINEFKRRKDLVQKYQRNEGISNKIQRLNWHSVRKKSSRINQKITQFTGLVSQTIDETFNEEEKRFKGVEKMIKSFTRNLSLFLEYFLENSNLQKLIAEDIKMFCNEGTSLDEVDSFYSAAMKVRDVICPQFVDDVKTRVFDPLERLLLLFQSPSRLIEKRHDKCLDYDRQLNRVQKIKEKEKQKQANDELMLSKRIYEALNSQLLEELPHLSNKCLEFFDYCLANLVKARCSYIKQVTEELQLTFQFNLIERLDSNQIIYKHQEALTAAAERLFSLVFFSERTALSDGSTKLDSFTLPREGASNFYIDLLSDMAENDSTSPAKPMLANSADEIDGDHDKLKPLPRKKSWQRGSQLTPSPTKSPAAISFDVFANAKSLPSPTKRTLNMNKNDATQLFIAEYTFEKEDEAEVSVEEGTVVNVLRKCDKDGNTEWWLVETATGRGYMPASYLSPTAANAEDEVMKVEAKTNNSHFEGCKSEASRHETENPTIDTKHRINKDEQENLTQLKSLNLIDSQNTRSTQDKPYQDMNPAVKSPVKQKREDRKISNTGIESSSKQSLLYKALYDFEATEKGECSLSEGDIARLLKMGDESGNLEWFRIEINGRCGYVPANYLEPIDIGH